MKNEADKAFEFHLKMRGNLNEAMKLGHILVLDIGSSKICSAIIEYGHHPQHHKLRKGMFAKGLGCKINGFFYSKSRGISNGEIVDVKEAASAISENINHTLNEAQQTCPYVLISYSGEVLSSQIYHGSVELDSQIVSEFHIARAINNCRISGLIKGQEFLHAHPVNFSIDQRKGMLDPRGKSGNRLAVDVHAITVGANAIEAIYETINLCGLKLAGIHSEAYASGLSTLVEHEQEIGTVIVNIGHSVTSIGGFNRKHMLFTDSIPIGSGHITHDICEAFSVSEEQAEYWKILYGGVFATPADDKVICRSLDGYQDSVISKAHLIGVIYPRVEEILEHLSIVLQSFQWGQPGSQQIVFTGGGSLLTGFDDLIREKFGHGIRIGRPVQLTGFPAASLAPPISSLIGLCLLVTQPQDEVWDFIKFDEYPPSTFVGQITEFLTWLQKEW